VLVLLLLPAALHAQPPAPPRFEAHTAAGTPRAGALEHLGANWAVRLTTGAAAVEVKGGDLVTLRRLDLPLPRHPTAPQVVLTNGDRVPLRPGSVPRLARGRLHFRPAAPLRADDLDPPVTQVALVWLAPPNHTEEPALLLRRLAAQRRAGDLVLLRDGDSVQGALLGLDDAGGCRVKAGRREVNLPLARVAVVALGTGAPPLPPAAGPHAHLVLSNGCRLGLASASADGKRQLLTGKPLFGAAVEAPLAEVVALDVRGGPAVYLSELEPTAYEHTPFLGATWPLVKDGSVSGRELRLGGSTYDRGLGAHAAARVTYDLAGCYRRFEALVGLDEDTARRGQARLGVRVDGKERKLDREGKLTSRGGPLRVRVDVRGARALTLVVDFDRFGDVQAHVNWVDARLIK
jgi:hypothetical protein